MSLVLDLPFEPPAGPSAPRRLIRASRILSILSAFLLVFFGLVAGGMILAFIIPFAGDHLALGPAGGLLRFNDGPLPPRYLAVADLPLVQRLVHVPVGVLIVAPILFVNWSLYRLFGLYSRGVVFARENAVHLKRIGLALMLHAAAPGLGYLFLKSLHLAIDRNWLHAFSFQEIVLGGVLCVVGQVMELGREIEEERSQFV